MPKFNDTIQRKPPDKWKDGQKDGRTEGWKDGWKDGQTLFYRTLLATTRDPKKELTKYLAIRITLLNM